jgi:hypothetical protein
MDCKYLLQVASISQLTVSQLSRQCGILNISQLYRPPLPVTGDRKLYFLLSGMGETDDGILDTIREGERHLGYLCVDENIILK